MAKTTPQPWIPAEASAPGADPRLFAPATQRNRDAILTVLRETLPATGLVLEIASGSGEHMLHFASALPGLIFQPSDPSAQALASIAAWTTATGATNMRLPLLIDAAAPVWPIAAADAILCINMVHIAPWSATEGLLRQAGAILPPGAPLYLYGPYRRADRELEPGNIAFDESLRDRNPDWGLRDLDAVLARAATHGFGAAEIVEMPADNLSVILRRR